MGSDKLLVDGITISLNKVNDEDYICLTDMVSNYPDGSSLIEKWLSNKTTLEFLAVWEELYNPDFNSPEFGGIKMAAGSNSFTMSVKRWIEQTNAKGVFAKTGRYGGTYAHKDIAFEFGSWLSPMFKLLLIKEFQRLKDEESRRLDPDWTVKRVVSKMNYRIHTDAIQANLIPPTIDKRKEGFIYANEADLLNKALFGLTASEWKKANPHMTGNMRDHATVEQLVVLSNLESLNAEMIKAGQDQKNRLLNLNSIAISQLKSITKSTSLKSISSTGTLFDKKTAESQSIAGPPNKIGKKKE